MRDSGVGEAIRLVQNRGAILGTSPKCCWCLYERFEFSEFQFDRLFLRNIGQGSETIEPPWLGS